MECHSSHLLALIIMVNRYYLVVSYCPVETRICLFGYLSNGCKVYVGVRTTTRESNGPQNVTQPTMDQASRFEG